jgi:nitronate monooxygenase
VEDGPLAPSQDHVASDASSGERSKLRNSIHEQAAKKITANILPMTKTFSFHPPVIQAPLAGGGDTPALVAAVCNAGALGFIGAAYLSPSQIREAGREVQARTTKPFGINLFAPAKPPEPPRDPAPALQKVAPFFAEVGLPAPSMPVSTGDPFEEQLAAALATGASFFSFTFGLLPESATRAIKDQGLFLIGTATTVGEALTLEKAGVDAVVTQGSEAGGHRGTFSAEFNTAMIGTISLVPQVADAVRIPVIASGGIMDGRGIVAALALGASAVQMGTAFLTCDEAGVPEAYKQAILAAREDQTRVTRAFSGKPARGIVNRFMTEVEDGSPNSILPFPLQNRLTRPLRTTAAKQGRAEFLSLWAGQGVRLARRQAAAQLIARLKDEMETAMKTLHLPTARAG